jgi:GAG-pre-integrase domain
MYMEHCDILHPLIHKKSNRLGTALTKNVTNIEDYLQQDNHYVNPPNSEDIDDTLDSIYIDLPQDTCPDDISSVDMYSAMGKENHPNVINAYNMNIGDCAVSIADGLPDDAAPDNGSDHAFAQFDEGANTNATNHITYLWNLRRLHHPFQASDIGGSIHSAHYCGYLMVKTTDGLYKPIRTLYCPSMKSTILCSAAIQRQYKDLNYISTAKDYDKKWGIVHFHSNKDLIDWSIELSVNNGLTWTPPLLRPTKVQRQSRLPKDPTLTINSFSHIDDVGNFDDDDLDDLQQCMDFIDQKRLSASDILNDNLASNPSIQNNHHQSIVESKQPCIHHLNEQAKIQLWHQRLGHCNHRTISELYKTIEGIPRLSIPNDAFNCPVCLQAKLTKSNSNKQSDHEATFPFQKIHVDLGFVCQHSKTKGRFEDNVGINGETCYIIVTDEFSGAIIGRTLVNKAPPENWLNDFLSKYAPNVSDKVVRMDQGGELG